jgi:hypothetical protein
MPLSVSRKKASDVDGYWPIDLSGLCNGGLELLTGHREPPVGDQVFHGLPFRIGNRGDTSAPCFVVLEAGQDVTVPVGKTADHIVVAHRRLRAKDGGDPAVGSAVAEYTLRMAGGQQPDVPVPVRERLEIAVIPEEGWDASGPFLTASSAQLRLADRYQGRWEDLGMRQSEGVFPGLADYFLLVWENPYPTVPVESIRLAALTAPVLIAAITAGAAGEYPLSREAARAIKITALGPDGPQPLCEPSVRVDRGVASYAFRLPGTGGDGPPDDPLKGWGEPADPESPEAYARVTAVPSATVIVADGDREIGRFRWRDLAPGRPIEQAGMRIADAEPGRNWVHVIVLDDQTGLPIPCRVAFRSPEGIPYQPHGHHDHVNSDLGTWHIDIGGDVRLGRLSYAYIDGTCQGWLPRGDVLVDVARGFEYEPLRERVHIAPRQRELTLRIRRWTSMNEQGWYSGDSHVHFLSAQGALIEQQGEDLNVVNLLQSQWGSLYTSTEEFTGSPAATPDGRHVTWVSQENRQPFFGHLVLWGAAAPDHALVHRRAQRSRAGRMARDHGQRLG